VKTHKFDKTIFCFITILCIMIYCLILSCCNFDMGIFIEGFRVFNPSGTLRVGLVGDWVGFRPIKVSGLDIFFG